MRNDVLLARATCTRRQNGQSVAGELSLYRSWLVFWTPESDRQTRIPLFSITAAVPTPTGHGLMVQSQTDSHWFTGPGVVALGERLRALRGDPNAHGFESDEIVRMSGPALALPGLRGQLVLTDRSLHFISRAPLLRWLGVNPDWKRPLTGQPTRGVLGWTARLAAHLLTTQSPVCGLWRMRQGLRAGALLLTHDAVCIISARPQTLPLSSIISTESNSDHLIIHQEDTSHQFRIPNAAIAQRRIRLAQTAHHQKTGEAPMNAQQEVPEDSDRTRAWSDFYTARLSSTRAVRLCMPDGEWISLTPGMVFSTEDGIGILFPAHIPCPEPGNVIRVELGQPDGLHRFDGLTLRTQAPPSSLQFPRRGRVLVLSVPDEVRYRNRRESWRVEMDIPVSAWRLRMDPIREAWIPDGDRLTGQLRDLSATGCAMQTTAAVPIGTRMFLELRILDSWIPLEAECVRREQGWPQDAYHIGIRFLNVPERLSRVLSSTVIRAQRGELAR